MATSSQPIFTLTLSDPQSHHRADPVNRAFRSRWDAAQAIAAEIEQQAEPVPLRQLTRPFG
jgi:hypothetical protein